MSTKENIKLVKQFFSEVFIKGDLSNLEEYLNPNLKYQESTIATLNEGIEGFRMREEMYQKAFPGKKVKIEDIFGEGDKVVVRWSVIATQRGELKGIPATGNEVDIGGIMIFQLKNNMINEIWHSWDRYGMLAQLSQVQSIPAFQ